MSYNSAVIVLVISNRPRATRSADLKLLAQLLPELYSTQSNYHHKFHEISYALGLYYFKGLILVVGLFFGGNFAFQTGLGLIIKQLKSDGNTI